MPLITFKNPGLSPARPLFISILVIVSFLSLSSSAHSQFNMPSFQEVVTTFFSRYNFDQYESYLKFQRKKDGWYVVQDRYTNPGNYYNAQLFWSKEGNSYRELDYPPTKADSIWVADLVSRYLIQINWRYEEYSYQRHKYYGYPGWDWDIIHDEEMQKADLSDSLLESKARAYGNYGSGFIVEQFGDLFLNNDPDRQPLPPTENISRSRVDKFLRYQQGAIEAYEAIRKKNPDYVTKVGNISTKLANEFLFTYLELAMAGDRERALQFARQAKYPDSLLAIARDYLKDLPPNSILITGGDNDTYPLWYLQQVKQFRPDIAVINFSLMGMRRYLSWLHKEWPQALFSTADSLYLQDDFDYFLYGNSSEEKRQLNLQFFLQELQQRQNPYDTVRIPYKSGFIRKYYARQLSLKLADGRQGPVMELGNYLFLNDYILLDIFQTNRSGKIFFTFPVELVSSLLVQKENIYALKLEEQTPQD